MCSCSDEVLISGPNVHFDAWSVNKVLKYIQ